MQPHYKQKASVLTGILSLQFHLQQILKNINSCGSFLGVNFIPAAYQRYFLAAREMGNYEKPKS
jgi:hypothetical protein